MEKRKYIYIWAKERMKNDEYHYESLVIYKWIINKENIYIWAMERMKNDEYYYKSLVIYKWIINKENIYIWAMERIKNDEYYCEVKIWIKKISSLRADCFSCKKIYTNTNPVRIQFWNR